MFPFTKTKTPFKRRRPFKLTKGGFVFILYTIGVGAGAINTGNNLLYMIFGLFLGLILASGVLSDLSLWGLEMDIEFPISIEAGKICSVPFRIANRKKYLPSVSVRVELSARLAGEKISLRAFCPLLKSGDKFFAQFLFVPRRRGRLDQVQLRFLTQFPFGLLEKWWNVDSSRETLGMYVTPALVPIHSLDFPSVTQGIEAVVSSHRRGEGHLFSGVRNFNPSDNPKRIHWRTSAKRHSFDSDESPQWFIKEMEMDKSPEVGLLWNLSSRPPRWDERDVELFIQYTASLVNHFSMRRIECYLHVLGSQGTQRIGDENRGELNQSILEFLSVVDTTLENSSGLITGKAEPVQFSPEATIDVFSSFLNWRSSRGS